MASNPTTPKHRIPVRVLVALALRNLRRHLRRSVLTALAMILGGGLLILSFSLSDGSQEQWIRSGVRMGTGHVTVEHPRFRASGRVEDRLTTARFDARRSRPSRAPDMVRQVAAVSARLSVTGLASSAAGARPGAHCRGGPAPRRRSSAPSTTASPKGRYLVPGRPPGRVRRRRPRAQPRPAARVRVSSCRRRAPTGRSRRSFCASSERSEAACPDIDQATIHIPLEVAGAWLGTAGDVTSVGVVLVDFNGGGRLRGAAGARAPRSGGPGPCPRDGVARSRPGAVVGDRHRRLRKLRHPPAALHRHRVRHHEHRADCRCCTATASSACCGRWD